MIVEVCIHENIQVINTRSFNLQATKTYNCYPVEKTKLPKLSSSVSQSVSPYNDNQLSHKIIMILKNYFTQWVYFIVNF